MLRRTRAALSSYYIFPMASREPTRCRASASSASAWRAATDPPPFRWTVGLCIERGDRCSRFELGRADIAWEGVLRSPGVRASPPLSRASTRAPFPGPGRPWAKASTWRTSAPPSAGVLGSTTLPTRRFALRQANGGAAGARRRRIVRPARPTPEARVVVNSRRQSMIHQQDQTHESVFGLVTPSEW